MASKALVYLSFIWFATFTKVPSVHERDWASELHAYLNLSCPLLYTFCQAFTRELKLQCTVKTVSFLPNSTLRVDVISHDIGLFCLRSLFTSTPY
jgi:hypothetical protein